VRPYRHSWRDSDVDHGTLCPPPNFGAPIHQRVLRILEIKNSRPDQPVNPLDDSLQDLKNGSSFLDNPVLALLVKRTVKTISDPSIKALDDFRMGFFLLRSKAI
jgi:hypothetical protein